MNLRNVRLFSKKLLELLLTSLILPVTILAQEPDGVLLTGLFTDSADTTAQEVLNRGMIETFNVQPVWTYDQTDIITGPLEAFAAAKGIGTVKNGLAEPLLSKISGYQQTVIAHSAGVITAVNLAKQSKLWGDKLYIASPALSSQPDLRIIRDLTAEGKGFKEIVVYTGDDMIPDFKEVDINFSNYTVNAKLTENLDILLTKVVYEDRGREINVLKGILNDFVTITKARLGKEPVSITIDGETPGNKFKIIWEDGTVESFNLQKDSQTGEDFEDEENIKAISLYERFPHGLSQLEMLEKFYREYRRMPGKEDLGLFKQFVEEYQSKSDSFATTARDPNSLSVSPEGDVRPGDKLKYTINYENEGEGIAFGVYFTDTLDENLDNSTLEIGPVIDVERGQKIGEPGIYNPTTRTITWFIGEVGSKQGGYAEFSINVKSGATDGTEIINFATVYFPSVPEVTRTNGTVNRVTTTIDNIPPITTAIVSPLPNQTGWNSTDVTISLSAADNGSGSGLVKTEYSLDAINWITYTTSFSISNEGVTRVYYRLTDNAGNTESPKILEIKLDKTPPTITAQSLPQPNVFGWNNTDVTVSFSAADTLSGVASVSEPVTVTTEKENQYIGGEAVDLAGNTVTTYIILNLDKTPPALNIATNPDILWPPDHKLVDVTIDGEATDNLSGIAQKIFKVEDEYDIIKPIISDFKSVIQLESWRNGDDLDGRKYAITATIKDKADNQVSNSTTVICPHDQRKK